jgi:hypothetical protein
MSRVARFARPVRNRSRGSKICRSSAGSSCAGSARIAEAGSRSVISQSSCSPRFLFLAVWLAFPWPIALAYWVFVSLLVAATFIDFEHFIIPDEITIGGTAAGVLAGVTLPALMGEDSRWLSAAQSLGAACCYFWLLPKTILFFFRDTQSLGWTPMWTVQEYYSFVTRFVLGFGLAFELPVVVLALVKFGLVTYQFMARTRPYAIVLIFILATIITPTPDVLTLVALSLPMCLLYESCIWIAWFMQRKAARAG